MNPTLNKALGMAYITSKMCITNLEVAVHEMNVLNDTKAGKLQFAFEKLIQAHKKAMATIEKNIENCKEIESGIEKIISDCWE